MKIIITEEQLKFLVEQEDTKQGDYTMAPSSGQQSISPEEKFMNEPDSIPNCYDLLKFIDGKITEMLSGGKDKTYIGQMLSSNVKLDNLSEDRQNQLDPHNILRSDIVKKIKTQKGNQNILRLISDCTQKYGVDKDMLKNKRIFNDLKIKIVDIKRGTSDPQGAQCGRPNWGKASAACMKPLFSKPQFNFSGKGR